MICEKCNKQAYIVYLVGRGYICNECLKEDKITRMIKDVILFSIIALGFATFKIVKGINSFMKPKVYECAVCHSEMRRGSAIRIGKKSFCLNCFNKGH